MSSPDVDHRGKLGCIRSPRHANFTARLLRKPRRRYHYVPPAHKIVKAPLCIACIHASGEVCILRRREDGLQPWKPVAQVNPACQQALRAALPEDVHNPLQLTEGEFRMFKEAIEK